MFEYKGSTLMQLMDAGVPTHIHMWLNFITIVSFLGLVFIRRREAQIVVAGYAASLPLTMWFFSYVGLASKIVALFHVLIWLPLGIYLVIRLKQLGIKYFDTTYKKAFGLWMITVASVYFISNFWDVPDFFVYLANGCYAGDETVMQCYHSDIFEKIGG